MEKDGQNVIDQQWKQLVEQNTKDESITKKFKPLNNYKWQGIMWFLVIAAAITFGVLIIRINDVVSVFHNVLAIMKPIIVGLILAYILNPIMKSFEKIFYKLTKKDATDEKWAGRIRGLSLLVTIILLFVCIAVFLYLIIPDLIESISGLVTEMPERYDSFAEWVKNLSLGKEYDVILANLLNQTETAMEYVNNWLNNDLLKILNALMDGITGVFNVLYNFFIGLIVSIYILSTKEKFKGQTKKTLYALLPSKNVNTILELARDSDRIFLGFLSGKVIDSAIIGLICFVVLSILNMPYTLIVSVIIGVTNIIPFFGPYVGALPSTVLIALADPKAGLIFFIFIIILQQIDGNYIGPKILGDSTGLSAFWVIFSILLGSGLFGVIGMIFGVPTFAVIYHIFKKYVGKKLEKKKLPISSETYVEVYKLQGDELIYNDEVEQPVKEKKEIKKTLQSISKKVTDKKKEEKEEDK